jgi:hypothetical protein
MLHFDFLNANLVSENGILGLPKSSPRQMWPVIENGDGCLVVEVSGDETVDDPRSSLAADHDLCEGFVLACKGEALPPSDFRKLSSIPEIVGMAILSLQLARAVGGAAPPQPQQRRSRRQLLDAEPEFRCEIVLDKLPKQPPRRRPSSRPKSQRVTKGSTASKRPSATSKAAKSLSATSQAAKSPSAPTPAAKSPRAATAPPPALAAQEQQIPVEQQQPDGLSTPSYRCACSVVYIGWKCQNFRGMITCKF